MNFTMVTGGVIALQSSHYSRGSILGTPFIWMDSKTTDKAIARNCNDQEW